MLKEAELGLLGTLSPNSEGSVYVFGDGFASPAEERKRERERERDLQFCQSVDWLTLAVSGAGAHTVSWCPLLSLETCDILLRLVGPWAWGFKTGQFLQSHIQTCYSG